MRLLMRIRESFVACFALTMRENFILCNKEDNQNL